MHPALLAFKDLLASSTARAVDIVGLPINRMNSDVVYVWPWRVEEIRPIQHIPGGAQDVSVLPSLKIACLVFSANLETLELVSAAAFQSPVLTGASLRTLIQSAPMDVALMSSVFSAAKVQLRPCLSYALQSSAA